MSNFFKMQYGNWTKYHATQNLGPINTWTIPSTTTDVVSYSSEDTISLNGKGGHYETCYKAFTVERSGQYTISYDYNLPTINFYGTDTNYMHFGIFISTNEPPGGNMSTYADYNSGNCNGYEICGTASQYNSPGEGSASFTYNLTAGTTYYLWIPMMNLADGVQTYLTFTNLKWTETAESDLFEPIGILSDDNLNGFLQYENAQAFKTLTLCAAEGGTLTAETITGLPGDTITLSPIYNTYWRFSGYDVYGDGTLSNNTYTFGSDDEQIVSAYFKKNAFTATGTFAWGTWVQPHNYGHNNNGTAAFNSQLKAFTGDKPSTWPATNAAWNVSNASAYGFKATTKMSLKTQGNLRIYLTGAIQLNGSNKVTAFCSGNRTTGTFTANCNLGYNSTQGLARMTAHMSGYSTYNAYGTATLPTNGWTATGYAP